MRKADNLPPYCAVVKKSRSLNFIDPSGPPMACYGTALYQLILLHNKNELYALWRLLLQYHGRGKTSLPLPVFTPGIRDRLIPIIRYTTTCSDQLENLLNFDCKLKCSIKDIYNNEIYTQDSINAYIIYIVTTQLY